MPPGWITLADAQARHPNLLADLAAGQCEAALLLENGALEPLPPRFWSGPKAAAALHSGRASTLARFAVSALDLRLVEGPVLVRDHPE